MPVSSKRKWQTATRSVLAGAGLACVLLLASASGSAQADAQAAVPSGAAPSIVERPVTAAEAGHADQPVQAAQPEQPARQAQPKQPEGAAAPARPPAPPASPDRLVRPEAAPAPASGSGRLPVRRYSSGGYGSSRLRLATPAPARFAARGEAGAAGAASKAPAVTAAPAPSSPGNEAELSSLRLRLSELEQQGVRGRWILIALAIALGILILLAVALILVSIVRLRRWDRRFRESVERAEASAKRWNELERAGDSARSRLPALLQQVGDGPLSFDEEGPSFSGRALALMEEVDALAYEGQGESLFGHFSDPADAAVYLNGLLLSAAARLSRVEPRFAWDGMVTAGPQPEDPWVAMARLNRFFALLGSASRSIGVRRVAQAYSYRALAGYRILEAESGRPSWQRSQNSLGGGDVSRQAFSDIAEAARLDPEWKHTTFVEALLSSRFYSSGGPAGETRAELELRGLKRATELFKVLIDSHDYRGPARRRLARAMKRIAERSGEKGEFSDFAYLLNAFPSDEELTDESLAARRPASQDRFLWQWMLGDGELFASLDRLNVAEYRSFWIRLLDSKVHLRNWRADLAELRRKNPAMRDWAVQLLHAEAPLPLINPSSRRKEYLQTPYAGT